jgi:hypothetical protein
MDEPPALAARSEVEREQALADFRILQPFLMSQAARSWHKGETGSCVHFEVRDCPLVY